MKAYVCKVCGYIHFGEEAPERCPQCGAPKDKFEVKQEGASSYADEHKIGVAKGLDEEVVAGLRDNFNGECCEVGMYLAMSRQADREDLACMRRSSWDRGVAGTDGGRQRTVR